MTLSDRVVIMHEGRIQQIGTPSQIYAHPANRFVADFIGKANFLQARITALHPPDTVDVDIHGTRLRVPAQTQGLVEGSDGTVVVRPESIALEEKKPGALPGMIRESVYLGSTATILAPASLAWAKYQLVFTPVMVFAGSQPHMMMRWEWIKSSRVFAV